MPWNPKYQNLDPSTRAMLNKRDEAKSLQKREVLKREQKAIDAELEQLRALADEGYRRDRSRHILDHGPGLEMTLRKAGESDRKAFVVNYRENFEEAKKLFDCEIVE